MGEWLTITAQRAKERELQNLSDRTVALGFLCEHSISSVGLFRTYPLPTDRNACLQVNIFVEKTSPVLRSSLNEEAPLAKGYIDVLRCIVVDARPGENPDKARFVQQVRRACNMGGRTVSSLTSRNGHPLEHLPGAVGNYRLGQSHYP